MCVDSCEARSTEEGICEPHSPRYGSAVARVTPDPHPRAFAPGAILARLIKESTLQYPLFGIEFDRLNDDVTIG